MSEFIDFEDKSVDKAIEKACKELSVTREKLKYDIISYGSSGIFGLVGTKKALIRVTPPGKRRAKPKPSAAAPSKAPAESTAPVHSDENADAAKEEDSAAGSAVGDETDSDDAGTGKSADAVDTAGQKINIGQQPADESETSISELVDQAFGEPEGDDSSTNADIAPTDRPNNDPANNDPANDDPAATPRAAAQGDAPEAANWIKGFLEHAVREISPESVIQPSHGENVVRFHIEGGDAARLIGKKGQTLDAIQYIAEKAVHKQFGTGISFEIDVEGYLDRRKSELTQLATKLAQKASESGKPMVINRINAHDRRIVHLALKKNREIRTQSAGNGDLRKLLILPKKKSGVKKPENHPEKQDHAESETL